MKRSRTDYNKLQQPGTSQNQPQTASGTNDIDKNWVTNDIDKNSMYDFG